jgi:hypothetical protein
VTKQSYGADQSYVEAGSKTQQILMLAGIEMTPLMGGQEGWAGPEWAVQAVNVLLVHSLDSLDPSKRPTGEDYDHVVELLRGGDSDQLRAEVAAVALRRSVDGIGDASILRLARAILLPPRQTIKLAQ